MDQHAFQDEIAEKHCWGCGILNEHGLQIKSYWSDNEAVCIWQPKDYHMAGPKHILNGGIIATIIDCHSICTAIADAHRAEGRAMNAESSIWYATASLQVTYLKPTPIDEPVVLRARVKETKGRKTIVTCSLFVKEEECVRGEVVAVRVPPAWRQAP
ncbi:MAG: PaaI family thioesterase [Candidatus Methylomirabilales bacterium]